MYVCMTVGRPNRASASLPPGRSRDRLARATTQGAAYIIMIIIVIIKMIIIVIVIVIVIQKF